MLTARKAAAAGPATNRRLLLLVSGLWGFSGCFGGGNVPDLAEVTGTVTLDGKPLPNASVVFLPVVQDQEESRPASGTTDESGGYTLEYSTSESGARPGSYRVSISTYRPEGEDWDGNHTPGAPETVPNVYNTQTTLTADVKVDGPPIDFPLKSDAGPVVQPRPASDDEPSRDDGDSC